jgi:aminoglycoside phosphotransferase (APT) family kinase protein
MAAKTPKELKVLAKIISKEPSVDVTSFGFDKETENWKYYVIKDSINNEYYSLRFPQETNKNTDREKEFNLLAKINLELKAKGINIFAPNPKHIIVDDDNKLLFYKKLPGFELVPQTIENNPDLIKSIAKTIALIHSLNTDLLKDVGFNSVTANDIKENVQKTLDAIKSSGYVSERLLSYFQKKYIGVKKLWRIKPVLIHGNLQPENLLTYKSDVLAVEDFSNSVIGDPAKDLKDILSAVSHECRSEILKNYKSFNNNIDSKFEDRINFLIDFAWFEYLLFGIETDNEVVIKDALEVIANIEDKIFEEETAV